MSNLDMDNSGRQPNDSRSDISPIPKFGVKKFVDKKTNRAKVQLNTPIQPTPREDMPSKYDNRMSKKNYNLS